MPKKKNENSIVFLQANFAGWEPGHGQFRFLHPWKQYLKIGSLTRNCAYRIEALNGYLYTETKVTLKFPIFQNLLLNSREKNNV